MRVYAGIDPVTQRHNDLLKIIPAVPNARAEAEATLRRFRAELETLGTTPVPACDAELTSRQNWEQLVYPANRS